MPVINSNSEFYSTIQILIVVEKNFHFVIL